MTVVALPALAGEPGDLAAAAHQIDIAATSLREGADRIGRTPAALGAEGWSGPSAEEFTRGVERLAADDHRASELLVETAAALLAYASALEVARDEARRGDALGLIGSATSPGPGAEALTRAQAHLQGVLGGAAHQAHDLRARLAAIPTPISRLPGGVASHAGVAPSAVEETVVTLALLGALLAMPRDPLAGGTIAPVRAGITGRLGHRLLKPEEPGWRLSPSLRLAQGVGPRTVASATPARADIAASVAAGVLTAAPVASSGVAGGGWRLPGSG